MFARLRKEAGIKGHDGSRYQPRLHDFRHAFAIMRLVTWYREGKNVQRLLPHLSTYLGHARMTETTRYLSITRELLQAREPLLRALCTTGGETCLTGRALAHGFDGFYWNTS